VADTDSRLRPRSCDWLNQIEIYFSVVFSVVQRKVLTPGDFADLAALEAGLLGFQPLGTKPRRAHSNGRLRVKI
jgi:hypothetical protein